MNEQNFRTGQRVSYEDMANPRRVGTITEVSESAYGTQYAIQWDEGDTTTSDCRQSGWHAEPAMQNTTPEYLTNSHGAMLCVAPECTEQVKRNDATGRFYVTMGHPGFNSTANNGRGYRSEATANAAIRKLTSAARATVPTHSPVVIAKSAIAHAVSLAIQSTFEDGERREDVGRDVGLPTLATASESLVRPGTHRVTFENGDQYDVEIVVRPVGTTALLAGSR